MSTESGSAPITSLLNRAVLGDRGAEAQAVSLLYRQVHDIAEAMFRREPRGHLLQPTAVADDAMMRVTGRSREPWLSRDEYLGTIRRVIRHLLIDHARRRDAECRGGGRRDLPLHGDVAGTDGPRKSDMFAVNEALVQLREHDPVQWQIVVLKFFRGMSTRQIAATVGISARNVEYKWRDARVWLRRAVDR